MTGVSLTFLISTFGIAGMIFLKVIELRTGKPSLMSKVSGKTNHIVRKYYNKVRRFLAYFNRRNAVLLFRFVVFHTVVFVRKSYIWSKEMIMKLKPAQHLRDMVDGKGVIKKKGAVSFFLQRIAEEAQAAHEEALEEALAAEKAKRAMKGSQEKFEI